MPKKFVTEKLCWCRFSNPHKETFYYSRHINYFHKKTYQKQNKKSLISSKNIGFSQPSWTPKKCYQTYHLWPLKHVSLGLFAYFRTIDNASNSILKRIFKIAMMPSAQDRSKISFTHLTPPCTHLSKPKII